MDWFRGLAQDQLARGADGVYVFNWHGHAQTHRPLLTTMGSAETLTGLDKVYTALHRSIGPKTGNRVDAERDDRLYGEVPVTLYPTLTDCGPIFHVRVADEVEAEDQLETAELQIEMAHWSPADQIEVTLDEVALPAPDVRDAAAEDAAEPSDVSENAWLCWNLTAAQVGRGVHPSPGASARARCAAASAFAGRTCGNLFAVQPIGDRFGNQKRNYEEG